MEESKAMADRVALYISEHCKYRVNSEPGVIEKALGELRDQACEECRDPVKAPDRWECCAVYEGDLVVRFHELGDWLPGG